MIGRNIAANVLGGGTAAFTALLLIPLQVRQLGLEAYGLIGFLASIQVLFSLFDLGLSPAVTWYVARAGERAPVTARAVLTGVGAVYAVIGVALGLALAIAAPWLASDWLRLAAVPVPVAVMVIQLAGLALMLRWPVSLLGGLLAGLQRFGPLNVAKGAHAIVNFAGAVTVLFIWQNLEVFAAWLVLAAAIELCLYLVAVRASTRREPSSGPRGADLGSVWRYAATLAVISALSLILTQSDRVVLGRLVSTATLGAYAAAYNLLFGLTLIQLFVGSAVYPSFASDFAKMNVGRIRDRHHDAAQVIIYIYALPFSLLVAFGEPILGLFLAPDIARSAAVVLVLLAIGFLFNALAAVPYSLSIAGGLSRLPIVVNAFSLAWYLPAVVLGVIAYGPVGAAAAWAALNISYVFTLIPAAQRRLLGGGTLAWLRSAFVPFPVVGLVTFGLARLIVGLPGPQEPVLWLAIAVSAALYALVGFRLLSPNVRGQARHLVTRSLWTGPTPLA
jgi:O-antigen/teichoic acid export membrane protein